MKMLQNSAQTLPLFVGKVGEKTPPLCGAIPAERNYVAKVQNTFNSHFYDSSNVVYRLVIW